MRIRFGVGLDLIFFQKQCGEGDCEQGCLWRQGAHDRFQARFGFLGIRNSIPFPRVPGRIWGRHKEYRERTNKEYAINMIRQGYRLVFEDNPPPASFTTNNSSALEAYIRQSWRGWRAWGVLGGWRSSCLWCSPCPGSSLTSGCLCWTPLGALIRGARGGASSKMI